MRPGLLFLPLCLAAPALAQTPPAPEEPPPAAPADTPDEERPSLPPVPQVTPENTGPLISPATPGINLDAPPAEAPGIPPVLVTPPVAPPDAEALIPLDERNRILLEEGEDVTATVDADGRTVLQGNVRLRYRGYRVRADRVTIDENRREATFEGNVVIESGGESAFGDLLRLDLRARRFQDFTFGGGRAVVPPERIGPNLLLPLRLSGQTLTRVGSDIIATEGFLTTCDFPQPHYKFGFRRATLQPGHRLTLRDTTLYLNERRVLRIPHLAIPLTERRLRYEYLPEVGRTEEEGFFVKAALGYSLREALPGIARLDLMQRKGIGLGFDQAYRFGAAAGALALYGLRDQNRGVNNLSGRLNHQQRLFAGIELTANSDFQQNSYQALSPNSQSQRTVLNLTRTVRGLSSSLSMSLNSSDYGFGATNTRSLTFSQTAPLGPGGNVAFRYNGSVFTTPGIGGNPGTSRDDQSADVQARTRLGIFDLDVAANRNLSGGGGENYFAGTERLPEITFGTDTSRFARGWLRNIPLRITTGYGRFLEGIAAQRRETGRALFSVDANPTPISLPGDLSLQVGGRLHQTVYGNDAAQYVLSGRSQITRRLGERSSLNLAYGYLRPYGFAPLRADQSGSFNNANVNLNVEGPRVRLTLLTGYDIQRARSELRFPGEQRNPWQNLSLQLGLRPSGIFQTRFTASYDINSGRLRDLTNRVRVRVPGGLALDTGLRFDPRTGRFPQINGALETPLFRGAYNLSAFAGYNGFTRRFEYRNFALTRSWHDYELTITYVDQPYGFRAEKGVNVMFRLKALPVYQRSGVGQFGTALDTGTGEVF